MNSMTALYKLLDEGDPSIAQDYLPVDLAPKASFELFLLYKEFLVRR